MLNLGDNPQAEVYNLGMNRKSILASAVLIKMAQAPVQSANPWEGAPNIGSFFAGIPKAVQSFGHRLGSLNTDQTLSQMNDVTDGKQVNAAPPSYLGPRAVAALERQGQVALPGAVPNDVAARQAAAQPAVAPAASTPASTPGAAVPGFFGTTPPPTAPGLANGIPAMPNPAPGGPSQIQTLPNPAPGGGAKYENLPAILPKTGPVAALGAMGSATVSPSAQTAPQTMVPPIQLPGAAPQPTKNIGGMNLNFQAPQQPGVSMSAVPRPSMPTPAAQPTAGPSQDVLSQFQRFHASAFNPNSAVDKRKMDMLMRMNGGKPIQGRAAMQQYYKSLR